MMTGVLILSLLVVILPTVIPTQELCSVQDFLQSDPNKQAISLLRWFSNSVDIDANDRITWFHPANGSDESVFPRDCQYYTLGDSNSRLCRQPENLPNSLKINYIIASDNNVENRVRLALQIYYGRLQSYVENVYITEHVPNSFDYNPDRTFLIHRDLMRALKKFQTDNIEEEIRTDRSEFSTSKDCPEYTVPKLSVATSKNGKAIISWSGVTGKWMGPDTWVGLFLKHQEYAYKRYIPGGKTLVEGKQSGSYETSVPMNPDLNVRLFTETYESSVWRGPDVSEACRVNPVRVQGYDVLLQLYAKDGEACARLFVKKTLHDWRTLFYYSWVGFYSASNTDTQSPDYYEWVTNFQEDGSLTSSMMYSGYDVFVSPSCYNSIAPALDARFFIDSGYTELAMTEPWPAKPC